MITTSTKEALTRRYPTLAGGRNRGRNGKNGLSLKPGGARAAAPTLWPKGVGSARLNPFRRGLTLQPTKAKPAVQQLLHAADIPLGRSDRPSVMILWGRRGRGKTLGMTTLARMMLSLYRANKIKRRIMANYHVQFADLCAPYLVDRLVEFPTWAHDMLALVDELTAYFPNRRSMNSRNLHFSTFLQQIRKKHIDLIFTTQFPTDVDRQILQQIDYFIEPEQFWIPGVPGKHMRFYIHDWWGQETGKYYASDGRRKQWPPPWWEADWTATVYNVHTVHPLYVSDEVVAPAHSDYRHEIAMREWGTEMNQAAREEADAGDLRVLRQARTLETRRISRSFVEMVAALPDSFILTTELDAAKQLEPDIKTTADFAKRLEAMGWATFKQDNRWAAERIE